MASRKLLLLPGDGIGPEAMAEVKKLIELMNAEMGPASRPRKASSAVRPMTRMASRSPKPTWRRRWPPTRPVRRGRRTEMGWRALRGAARGRPAAPAQGHGALRQSAPRHLLSGAGRILLAEKEVVEGLDILIVRELTGGVYFGEPKRSSISATARSAASTRRSTTRSRSSAFPASPSSWRARAPTRSARWKSATS
jgi:3-isopropylmalate dehydrogenase